MSCLFPLASLASAQKGVGRRSDEMTSPPAPPRGGLRGPGERWLLKANKTVSTSLEALDLVGESLQEMILAPQAAAPASAPAVHEAVAGELDEVRLAERAHGGARPVRLEPGEVGGHAGAHGAQRPSGGVHVANVDGGPALSPGPQLPPQPA